MGQESSVQIRVALTVAPAVSTYCLPRGLLGKATRQLLKCASEAGAAAEF